MRVAVVGGAGYVGTNLVHALQSRGHEIELIDLFWFGNHTGIDVPARDALHITPEDLKGVDCVVFLAGLSSDPMAEFSPWKNFVGNGATPVSIAYAAKQAGVPRFVLASSCSVYGDAPGRMSREDDLVLTDLPYGIGKYLGEVGLLRLADEKFKVIVLRKGTISGHSPRMRLDLLINTMFRDAMTTGVLNVNVVHTHRPILFMRWAVHAYTKAVEDKKLSTGIINVANANGSILEAACAVKEHLETKSIYPQIKVYGGIDKRNYQTDLTRCRKELGIQSYNPIPEILDDLLEHRDEYGDFQDPSFYNIKVFERLP